MDHGMRYQGPGRHEVERRGLRGIAVALLFLALASGSAWAATQQLVLQGKVSDVSGQGLGGVQVKAFVDGFLRGQAISGAEGGYAITFPYDDVGDQTIAVWWLPVLPGQVPEIALLRESTTARKLGIWSPCLPRLVAQPSLSLDVTIYQEGEKFKALGQADCMQRPSNR